MESVIVDRIKKLLRLSKSPNIHEAQLALDRAFEIAAKHQIDVQTLDLGEDLNAIVTEACQVGYRLSLYKRLALTVVVRFFNVNAVVAYPVVKLIGTAADIAIAQHVFAYLADQSARSVAQVRREYGRRFTENRRRNFLAGYFYAINEGLDKGKDRILLEESRLALVLVEAKERRDRRQRELIPETVSVPLPQPKRRERTWLGHGYIEGKKVKINPSVPAPAAVAQLEA
jgi:hypothetical protein